MKQTAIQEKMDPLTRIQEEIKEVVRREEEHKQFLSGILTNENGQSLESTESLSIRSNLQDSTDDELLLDDNSNPQSLKNKKSFTSNENQSDDSGISGASSPVNGTSTNNNITTAKAIEMTTTTIKEQRYIRPLCYSLTPEPPQQKLSLRTIPSPLKNGFKNRKFNVGPAQKGLMQRFIASRGKIQTNNTNDLSPARSNPFLNEKALATLSNGNGTLFRSKSPNYETQSEKDFRSIPFLLDATSARVPASIERDENGHPVRPGYVPVELKIQRELRDLKTRECELRKMRKVRQSTPDLLNALENEDTDDDDVDYTEHCYGPNKLRSAKSISELSDATHYVSSFSSSNIISEDIKNELQSSRNDTLKPAVSLAQLCDLDPQEAPSSHRLIAQWESLIQQNA